MTLRTRLPLVAVTATVLVAGLLTGCGDDKPSADASTSDKTTTKTTTSPEASADPTEKPSDPTGTAADPALAEFCAAGADFSDATFLQEVDSTDTAAIQKALSDAVSEGRKIDVPSEVADDWETMMAAFGGLGAALDGLDVNNEADADVFAERMEALGTAEVEAASDNIDAFLDANCAS